MTTTATGGAPDEGAKQYVFAKAAKALAQDRKPEPSRKIFEGFYSRLKARRSTEEPACCRTRNGGACDTQYFAFSKFVTRGIRYKANDIGSLELYGFIWFGTGRQHLPRGLGMA